MIKVCRNQAQPLRIIQLTDCHLGSQLGEDLLGLDTDLSLADVLESIRYNESKADLLLATGDLSNDGGLSSYERFLTTVRTALPDTDVAWLAGNHDDPSAMARVSQPPIENAWDYGAWRLIFLNSRIPGEEGGGLAATELERLQGLLSECPDKATLIALHHQPVPVGSAWVDKYILNNATEFFEVVDQHAQVKIVTWGHVHQEFVAQRGNVSLYATPSTCVQFAPNLDEFQVDRVMPGYRWFDLYDNGRFETNVVRVADKSYAIDYASVGY